VLSGTYVLNVVSENEAHLNLLITSCIVDTKHTRTLIDYYKLKQKRQSKIRSLEHELNSTLDLKVNQTPQNNTSVNKGHTRPNIPKISLDNLSRIRSVDTSRHDQDSKRTGRKDSKEHEEDKEKEYNSFRNKVLDSHRSNKDKDFVISNSRKEKEPLVSINNKKYTGRRD